MKTERPAPGLWLSRVAIALAGLEVVVLLGFIALFATMLSSSEALSRNIAQAVIALAAILLIVLALPALVLGIRRRAPRTALTLALLVLPVVALLVFFA